MSILDVFALLGGVGLFLYGMMEMSSGLKNAAGDNLRIILTGILIGSSAEQIGERLREPYV